METSIDTAPDAITLPPAAAGRVCQESSRRAPSTTDSLRAGCPGSVSHYPQACAARSSGAGRRQQETRRRHCAPVKSLGGDWRFMSLGSAESGLCRHSPGRPWLSSSTIQVAGDAIFHHRIGQLACQPEATEGRQAVHHYVASTSRAKAAMWYCPPVRTGPYCPAPGLPVLHHCNGRVATLSTSYAQGVWQGDIPDMLRFRSDGQVSSGLSTVADGARTAEGGTGICGAGFQPLLARHCVKCTVQAGERLKPDSNQTFPCGITDISP